MAHEDQSKADRDRYAARPHTNLIQRWSEDANRIVRSSASTLPHDQSSTDTSLRYAAYGSRVRTILLSAHRYVAYTSDIGESIRPVAHPYLIRSAYAVSWLYLVGDVAFEGRRARKRNQAALSAAYPAEAAYSAVSTEAKNSADLKAAQAASPEPGVAAAGIEATSKDLQPAPKGLTAAVPPQEHYVAVMAQRAIFQGLASMALPAFTIHSMVKYSGKALKNVKNQRVRTYGPIGLGLLVVPALPYVFDHPVEGAVEWLFEEGFQLYGKMKERRQEEQRKKEL